MSTSPCMVNGYGLQRTLRSMGWPPQVDVTLGPREANLRVFFRSSKAESQWRTGVCSVIRCPSFDMHEAELVIPGSSCAAAVALAGGGGAGAGRPTAVAVIASLPRFTVVLSDEFMRRKGPPHPQNLGQETGERKREGRRIKAEATRLLESRPRTPLPNVRRNPLSRPTPSSSRTVLIEINRPARPWPTMCDHTQVEYTCGHVRYLVRAWCVKYEKTHIRCPANVVAVEFRLGERCSDCKPHNLR